MFSSNDLFNNLVKDQSILKVLINWVLIFYLRDWIVYMLRLGHINKDKMIIVERKCVIPNMKDVDFQICDLCIWVIWPKGQY